MRTSNNLRMNRLLADMNCRPDTGCSAMWGVWGGAAAGAMAGHYFRPVGIGGGVVVGAIAGGVAVSQDLSIAGTAGGPSDVVARDVGGAISGGIAGRIIGSILGPIGSAVSLACLSVITANQF